MYRTGNLIQMFRLPPGAPVITHPPRVSDHDIIRQKAAALERFFVGRQVIQTPGASPATGLLSYTRGAAPIPGQQSFMFPQGVAGITTPANNGLDNTVFSFRVPDGYVGVIDALSHNYTGGGLVQGSGDLTWRITIDGRAVKNYDAITVEFGSPQQRLQISGIAVEPSQTVAYVVNHAVASGLAAAGTRILCFMGGAFWPVG